MVVRIEGSYFSFECGVVADDKLCFVDFNRTEIFVYDLDEESLVTSVKLYDKDIDRAFTSAVFCDGVVYLFPFKW